MFTFKKIFSFFILFLFLFSALGGFCLARDLEVTYPTVPNAIFPTKVKNLLPEYVKYVFNFAIVISGLIAFGSLIYGGFRYVTSVGSPNAITDARGQMFAGILGLVFLLSSYLILTTINPQLIILTPGTIEIKWGIVIYKNLNCSGESQEITKNTSDLGGFNDNVKSIEFLTDPENLDIDVFPQTNYCLDEKGNEIAGCIPQRIKDVEKTGSIWCKNFDDNAGSIAFVSKLPGVYLVKTPGKEKFLPGSAATLGDFDNQVQGIRFQTTTDSTIKYGAVLHENQNWQGICEVFLGNDDNLENGTNPFTEEENIIGKKTSSVTVFAQSNESSGDGVTFYENEDYTGEHTKLYSKIEKVPQVENAGIPDNSISSIKIQGNYMAVLFADLDYKGTCQVFTGSDESDANLRDDPMGRCNCGPYGWGCEDCLSSFIIIPTK